MPATVVILQSRICPLCLAALLVTLRLARRELDLLATAWIVVDQWHMHKTATDRPPLQLFAQHSALNLAQTLSFARASIFIETVGCVKQIADATRCLRGDLLVFKKIEILFKKSVDFFD